MLRVENGLTLLHLAARAGQTRIAALLVEAGAAVVAVDTHGHLPLFYAAQRAQHARDGFQAIEMGRILLDAMFKQLPEDGEAEAWQCQTLCALSVLEAEERAYAFQLLVDAGADLNARDESGATALHHAALHGQVEALRQLLDLEADVQRGDDRGDTPLHRAVTRGSGPCVAALLKAGADMQAGNNAGASALDCARRGEFPAILALLQAHPSCPRAQRRELHETREYVRQELLDLARGDRQRREDAFLEQEFAPFEFPEVDEASPYPQPNEGDALEQAHFEQGRFEEVDLDDWLRD